MRYIKIVDADYMNTGACVTIYKDLEGNVLENFEPEDDDVCVENKQLHFDQTILERNRYYDYYNYRISYPNRS